MTLDSADAVTTERNDSVPFFSFRDPELVEDEIRNLIQESFDSLGQHDCRQILTAR